MFLQENDVYFPNITYEIPECNKNGYFLFSSESGSSDEARLNIYKTYPPRDGYVFWRGYFGCAHVKSLDKYIRMEKGNAIYFGDKPFDIYEILSAANFDDGRFHQNGITVMDNIICKIKVMKRTKESQLYHGDSIIKVFDQFIFYINDHAHWGGFIENYSFKCFNNFILAFFDSFSQKEYLFGESTRSAISIFSAEKGPVKIIPIYKNDFFIVALPREVTLSRISLGWIQPRSGSKKNVPTTRSIDELYEDKYDRLSKVLQKFTELGIELNIQKELEKFSNAPDFIECCSKFLEEKLLQYPSFLQKSLDKNKRFKFHVDASYDKAYYCAAKLADSAIDIQANLDSTVYYITFDGTQIEEIDLMYYNLANSSNTDKDYMVEIFTYLKENLFFVNLQSSINSFIVSPGEPIGYSSFVRNSVLISIIKSINKNRRKKLDILYTEMIKENRVNVKWGSEYKLFDLISKYVNDAIYQYRTVLLGLQSFDIFLPSQNIAIEYQGLQHYEAVDIFGGQDALERNIERDDRKRQISSEYGIIVLDWKYDIPIDKDSVLSFLKKNKIALTPRNTLIESNNMSLLINMAPIQTEDVHKDKEKDSSQFVIKQYSTDGGFVADYWSYEEASQAVAVSKLQIQNALRRSSKTAGGYQWRRVPFAITERNNLPIEPVIIESTAKAVYQMSSDGKVVAEYESINKASKSTGVDSKSIRCVLNKTQKTAGGFKWIYKES